MKMRLADASSLWTALSAGGIRGDRFLWGATATARLADLGHGSSLGARRKALCDRSVLLAIEDQLAAALALIELDGFARRLILCPPGLPAEHLAAIMGTAEVDAIVSDRDWRSGISARLAPVVAASTEIAPAAVERGSCRLTEWILLTSGTTGVPKLVVHDFATLAGPIKSGGDLGPQPVWSTFYDIRRYGGLQIFFRAVLGGGSMVLLGAQESTGDFLARAGAHGVTHISGTPSHWRRALMSSWAGRIAPRYVRLSGEIADQTILDQLHATYPEAGVAHAFASTEAGVGFEVDDGRAGFPAALIGRTGVPVELRIVEGSIRIRSSRTGRRYLGKGAAL